MIIKFKYGFEFKGKLYGWNNKKLYRLPQMIGKRFYSLLECAEWEDKGYFLGSERKSFKQLKAMTHYIGKEVETIESDDVPF